MAHACDPLIRLRAWMRATGRWDDDAEAERRRGARTAIDRAVAEVAAAGVPPPEMLFDNVWADDPPGLAARTSDRSCMSAATVRSDAGRRWR